MGIKSHNFRRSSDIGLKMHKIAKNILNGLIAYIFIFLSYSKDIGILNILKTLSPSPIWTLLYRAVRKKIKALQVK